MSMVKTKFGTETQNHFVDKRYSSLIIIKIVAVPFGTNPDNLPKFHFKSAIVTRKRNQIEQPSL
jgi:hypothetical protein